MCLQGVFFPIDALVCNAQETTNAKQTEYDNTVTKRTRRRRLGQKLAHIQTTAA